MDGELELSTYFIRKKWKEEVDHRKIFRQSNEDKVPECKLFSGPYKLTT